MVCEVFPEYTDSQSLINYAVLHAVYLGSLSYLVKISHLLL